MAYILKRNISPEDSELVIEILKTLLSLDYDTKIETNQVICALNTKEFILNKVKGVINDFRNYGAINSNNMDHMDYINS